MTEPAKPATGSGLLEFLTWAGQRGEINPSTATSFASASRNVLSIEENPDEVELRSLDVEQLLERFENRSRTKYSTSSLNTYKGRFRQSVWMYLAWLDKDPAWKSAIKPRSKSSNGAKKPTATQQQPPSSSPPKDEHGHAQTSTLNAPPAMPPSAQLIKYQLPLRPDLLVSLDLPVDLTAADAMRIAAFVKSLAFDSGSPSDSEKKEG